MCAERRNSMNFSKGFDGFWASSIWCKPRKSQGGGFLATSDLFLWFLTTLDMFAEKSIASSKQLLSWAFDRSFWSKAGTCRPQQFANQGHGGPEGESPYYLLSFVFKPQQHKWKWRTPFMTEAGNNTTMPPTLQFENDPFSPRWWKMNNLIGEMSSVHPLPRPCLCWNLNHIAGHVAKNEFRHFVCLWSKERFFRILCKDDFLRKLTRHQVALPAFVGQIENENKQNVS